MTTDTRIVFDSGDTLDGYAVADDTNDHNTIMATIYRLLATEKRFVIVEIEEDPTLWAKS